jgi:hypothetical protein
VKKIKLFLAATDKSLVEDRMAVADLINYLNDKYEDKGIYFQLVKARALPEPGAFSDCEMAFVIWFHKSDEIMDACFEAALAQFQTAGKPKIITYFRQVDGTGEQDEDGIAEKVTDYMLRLDQELGHYYNLYSHIDSLRFSLLMQIGMLERDISLECRNGQLLVDGDKLMSLYDVPCGSGNKNVQALQKEFKQITARFYELREIQADNEDDQALTDEFMAVAEKRNALRGQIGEIEKNILTVALSMAGQIASGSLSQRQKEAYRLFEKGDYEGANAVLCFDEIKEDIVHAEQAAELVANKLQLHVNELLQKVDLLKANGLGSDAFKAIRECLREAVRVEEAHHLPKNAMLQLFLWLIEHHDVSEAKGIGERLLIHMQLEAKLDLFRESMIRYKLAEALFLINQYDEALDQLQVIGKLFETPAGHQMLEQEQERELFIQAGIIKGRIYLKLPDQEDQLTEVLDQVGEYYLSEAFSMDFNIFKAQGFHEYVLLSAEICRKLGILEEAISLASTEIELLEAIETDTPEDFKLEHACYIFETQLLLGELYFDTGVFSKARETVENSWRNKMDFVLEDSIRFAPVTMRAYASMARGCALVRNFDRAWFYLDDGIDYAKFLVSHIPEAYGADLARLRVEEIAAVQNMGAQLDLSDLKAALKLVDESLTEDNANRAGFINIILPVIGLLSARRNYIVTWHNADQFEREAVILEKYLELVFAMLEENEIRDTPSMLYVMDQLLRFCYQTLQLDPAGTEFAAKMIAQAKAYFELCQSYPERGCGDFSGLLNRYWLTYYTTASLCCRLSDEAETAAKAARDGLELLRQRNQNEIEPEFVYDYALLQIQLAEAEFALGNPQAAISGYEAASAVLNHLNEAMDWDNWPDVHLQMQCYLELVQIANGLEQYLRSADYLAAALEALPGILFKKNPKDKEDAYCLLAWDYARLLCQLSGLVNPSNAISYLNEGIENITKHCSDAPRMAALRKAILFLKLQRAYLCTVEEELADVPPDMTDTASICAQHLQEVYITDQDIHEWWSFYQQKLNLPRLE